MEDRSLEIKIVNPEEEFKLFLGDVLRIHE